MSKVLPIHTSDRILFKRCRRKWDWSSHIRQGYQPEQSPGPLWLGIGFHFGLEDFHGVNKYGGPVEAFKAYASAYERAFSNRLPEMYEELLNQGIDMLNYYTQWLKNRDPLVTYIENGVPQVERSFEIDIPVKQELIDRYNRVNSNKIIDKVVYKGTIDRVIIDEDDRLWLLDYKTAKAFGTLHFETDTQISAYCWAASTLFNKPIAGFIYQQHKKTIPDHPKFLKTSQKYSIAKNQSTTRALYKEALLNAYISLEDAPPENLNFLNYLAGCEHEDSDNFIRRDKAYRNEHQIEAEGANILLEAEDMLNPDLPIYTNPTRDCSWDCTFQEACIMKNAGADWEGELDFLTVKITSRDEKWRQYLK